MSAKLRNSLLGVSVIMFFILGTPLIERIFAGAVSMAESVENTLQAPASIGAGEAPFQALKVGDRYFKVVPTGDGSVAVEMYDSNFELVAANENEAALTFPLPGGGKEILRISVHYETECSMPEHSSGGGDCCASGSAMPQESCPHEE